MADQLSPEVLQERLARMVDMEDLMDERDAILDKLEEWLALTPADRMKPRHAEMFEHTFRPLVRQHQARQGRS